MLDLNAVENPVWEKTKSFLGVPFIWCAIENFGGRSGLYSTSLTRIASAPAAALAVTESNGTSMVGVGMTPEGIETNPLNFNLIAETFWHEGPLDAERWLRNYTRARYGLNTRSKACAAAADAAAD
eukprot:gene1595-8910_t